MENGLGKSRLLTDIIVYRNIGRGLSMRYQFFYLRVTVSSAT